MGLNGFLHFIPQPPSSNPVAVQFMTAVSVSHFIGVAFLVQLIGGVLLFTGVLWLSRPRYWRRFF
jgi:putative oxidoreductase